MTHRHKFIPGTHAAKFCGDLYRDIYCDLPEDDAVHYKHLPDDKIERLVLNIDAKLFTTPTLPNGTDVVRAVNALEALVEASIEAKRLLRLIRQGTLSSMTAERCLEVCEQINAALDLAAEKEKK